MLAVGDYVAQIIGRYRSCFFGDQRRAGEVAPRSGFSVALRAILLKDRVLCQGALSS